MLAKPQPVIEEKPIYEPKPAPMSQVEREEFRARFMARYANTLAQLAR